ncbi:DUF421 domain-containing protein [Paenibacillus humicola]|uniref:DUF421 domain-containing protein n=1 Tax=Paenibacillus humicola TaxID=3110540 RepID=UPI00237BBF46|nr:hypothetical protein [Paenibacillus humicola]
MEIYIKVVFSFAVLLLLARLMGKKKMGQLIYFNYITGITLGSLTATFIIDSRISLATGLGAVSLWAGLTLLLGMIVIKSRTAKLLFDGESAVVIKHGQIQDSPAADRGREAGQEEYGRNGKIRRVAPRGASKNGRARRRDRRILLCGNRCERRGACLEIS